MLRRLLQAAEERAREQQIGHERGGQPAAELSVLSAVIEGQAAA